MKSTITIALLAFCASATAQLAPSGGLITGPEQRVASARIGPPDSSPVAALGFVPRSDGVHALSTLNDYTGTRPVFATMRLDRRGHVIAGSDRLTGGMAGTTRVGSTEIPLVAWRATDSTIRASRLRADGSLADPTGTVLAGPSPYLGSVSVECNASRCLVTWSDRGPHAVLLDGDAHIVATVPLTSYAMTPLTADADGFLVALATGRATSLVRIDNSGRQTFETQLGEMTLDELAADYDGAGYSIAFVDGTAADRPVVVQRVSLTGTLGAKRSVFTPGERDRYSGLALAWNGEQHLITVAAGRGSDITFEGLLPSSNLYGIRLDPNHIPVGSPFVIASAEIINRDPIVTANGDGFQVAWTHARGSFEPFTVLASFVDATGAATPPEPLRLGAISQLPQTIASTGAQSLAVWIERDRLTTRQSLYAMRMSSDNVPLDDAPLLLSDSLDYTLPDVAALGSDYLVVWLEALTENTREVRGAIVRGDGRVERPSIGGINAFAPSVASDGASWLIVGANSAGVRAMRISRSGIVLTPQPTTLMQPASERDSLVASNGSGFLAMAFISRTYGCRDECGGTFAIPINADGTLASPPIRHGGVSSSASAFESNGRDYLFASARSDSIELKRLTPAGIVASTFFIPTRKFADRIVMTRLAGGWLVAWSADRTDSFIVRVDDEGRPLTAPVPSTSFIALATKNDTTAIGLYSSTVDDATAAFVRDVMATPLTIGRRRTASP